MEPAIEVPDGWKLCRTIQGNRLHSHKLTRKLHCRIDLELGIRAGSPAAPPTTSIALDRSLWRNGRRIGLKIQGPVIRSCGFDPHQRHWYFLLVRSRVDTRFDVAISESLGAQFRNMPWFFVLVLSVSGTRTRRYRIEYEYHFIEYEYER
jgi:hypothetical protein